MTIDDKKKKRGKGVPSSAAQVTGASDKKKKTVKTRGKRQRVDDSAFRRAIVGVDVEPVEDVDSGSSVDASGSAYTVEHASSPPRWIDSLGVDTWGSEEALDAALVRDHMVSDASLKGVSSWKVLEDKGSWGVMHVGNPFTVAKFFDKQANVWFAVANLTANRTNAETLTLDGVGEPDLECGTQSCGTSSWSASTPLTILEAQRCHVQPGAFAIDPRGDVACDDDSVNNSSAATPRVPSLEQSTEWSQAVLVEANLVEDELYRPKVLVEATPLKPEGRRIHPFFWLLGLVAVLATVAGTTVALVYRSKANDEAHFPYVTHEEALEAFRNNLAVESLAALDNLTTPQGQAYKWLRSEDDNPLMQGDPEIRNRAMRQRFALATLYYATGGPQWKNHSRWLTQEHECTWYYDAKIQGPCQSDTSTIVGVGLTGNGLNGSLPSELSLLSSLTVLSIETNANLTGTIPKSLQHLTALSTLSLAGNELAGTLPELNATTAFLDLSGNRIQGSIPESYAALQDMESFVLLSNDLTGTIPWELLPSVSTINLADNQFHGSLGSHLGGLSRLTSLSLSLNQLNGTLPTELGLLRSAQLISLWHNRLSGPVPTHVGSLTHLTKLDLFSNQLTGPIPTELGLLKNLQVLYLEKNALTGTLPEKLLTGLPAMKTLSVQVNQLNGTIPRAIGSLSEIQYLYLKSNEFHGTVPTELGQLQDVMELFLNANQLTGTIPTELGMLTSLTELQLDTNLLKGPIPTQLGLLTRLSSLTLHGNPALTGRVPKQLCDLVDKYHLDLQVDCVVVRCLCHCTCINTTSTCQQ